MNALKILIDTNILIGLEDNREIDSAFSSLHQKCHENGVQIFVHEASKRDIQKDKDIQRRSVILSKIAKFPEISGIQEPGRDFLESKYGAISKSNDHIDVLLLYTLHDIGAVDFLVTQDRGLHKRAIQAGISDRVFNVEDALVWLRNKYDRTPVVLPFIEEKRCHQINRTDSIFSSLQTDYAGFDKWFSDTCVKGHRGCWTINFEGKIAGIAIRKDESSDDFFRGIPASRSLFQRAPDKILKICTLKIGEEYRGEKFGEQLLKQILWWANRNKYEFAYLTVFPKHKNLIDLLLQYGFEVMGRSTGELYMGKAFSPGILTRPPEDDPLLFHRQYYPAFRNDNSIEKYLIPIHSEYYDKLFPENISKRQDELFDVQGFGKGSRIPGNTIRKVYVSHTPIKAMKPGAILLFFQLKDDNSLLSQSLITVGIVDGFETTQSHEKLLQFTAKRSVFSESELVSFTSNDTKAVKIVNFFLAGHIRPPVAYKILQDLGIKGPYQSIRKIDHEKFMSLEKEIQLDVKST